jgi:hypothetical protein
VVVDKFSVLSQSSFHRCPIVSSNSTLSHIIIISIILVIIFIIRIHIRVNQSHHHYIDPRQVSGTYTMMKRSYQRCNQWTRETRWRWWEIRDTQTGSWWQHGDGVTRYSTCRWSWYGRWTRGWRGSMLSFDIIMSVHCGGSGHEVLESTLSRDLN